MAPTQRSEVDLLDSIDHFAIPVMNVAEAVEWYGRVFRCSVTYQDETWALLNFANTRLALIKPEQHPAHIGFVSDNAADFGELKTHRDGSQSCYVRDPSGNAVEIMDRESVER